ncbi:MAG: hypothetical protein ACLFQG_04955 [Desulfovermiculus sp.]
MDEERPLHGIIDQKRLREIFAFNMAPFWLRHTVLQQTWLWGEVR